MQIETNEESKKVNPHCCSIKPSTSGKLETVGCIPREISRHFFFLIGEWRGRVDDLMLSINYHLLLISIGGLEIR